MQDNATELKLFMILVGSRAPGRNVEQHDFFFCIGDSMKSLVPEIKAFWKEAKDKIHVDGWREVNAVEGFKVTVVPRSSSHTVVGNKKLFFVNLGGYQKNKFEEQHYVILTVKDNRAAVFREAKDTFFYKNNHFKGAESHIDDKYGIDVDDLYEIEDILPPSQKELYRIELTPLNDLPEDELHLGYFKLSNL